MNELCGRMKKKIFKITYFRFQIIKGDIIEKQTFPMI